MADHWRTPHTDEEARRFYDLEDMRAIGTISTRIMGADHHRLHLLVDRIRHGDGAIVSEKPDFCSLITGSGFTFAPRPLISLVVCFGPSPEASVTIRTDGTIECGKDYVPDAAARAFWDAVGLERKERK